MAKKYTLEDAVVKFKEKHGNKYDYSNAIYVNSQTKIEIICPEHGSFWQRPNDHIYYGCPKCGFRRDDYNMLMSTDEFIRQCREVHGLNTTKSSSDNLKYLKDSGNFEHLKYSYEKTVYTGRDNYIIVTCKIHGDFNIKAYKHKKGKGCPECYKLERYTKEKERIIKIRKEFNYPECYDDLEIKDGKVSYVCTKHCTQNKIAKASFITGKHACKMCDKERRTEMHDNKYTTELFIEKSRKIFGDTYTYDNVVYKRSCDDVYITCKEHGDFRVTPNNHLKGTGCPRCKPIRSKAEEEIYRFIGDGIQNDRRSIYPLELDLRVGNLAIEYDGLMYHSFGESKYEKFDNASKEDPNKHLIKTEMCENKGIHLLHIFENEWIYKKDIWKQIINQNLGIISPTNVDKCTVKEISSKEAETFLENNHLMGYVESDIHIGLYRLDDLIQVMTFRYLNNNFELTRMCNKLGIVAEFSKIFDFFKNTFKPDEITSYADRRWSDGSEYEKLGFKFSHYVKPKLFYFLPNTPKLELKEKPENPRKYRKIYDCGGGIYKYK